MAGCSSGIIDSFQYYGAMLSGWGVGQLFKFAATAPRVVSSATSALATAVGPAVHAALRTLEGPLQLEGKGTWSSANAPSFEAIVRVPLEHQEQLSPLLRLAFKKGGLNETIKPIFVKLIEASLNLAVLGLQSSDRLIPELLLVRVALM